MTMQPKIQMMIDKFHRRMEKDEEAREQVKTVMKTINIDLGEETYNFRLEAARIDAVREGLVEGADITLKTTPEHLDALIEGTLRPMKAYVTKKIQVKGKIEDVLHLRKFF